MDVFDKLIVSPTNVKFQAPFPHNQKRQMSLLNVSDKDMMYSIELDNRALFQVIPSSGLLATYDTIELIILMKPASANQAVNVLRVKYMAKPEKLIEPNESDQSDQTVEDLAEQLAGDWSEAHTAEVKITLENCVENEKEMLRMFALDGNTEHVTKVFEQYQPVCTTCCLKRTNPQVLAKKASRTRLLFWPACITVLSFAVYFGSKFFGLRIFDLHSEKVF